MIGFCERIRHKDMKHFTICLLFAASFASAQRGPASEPPATRAAEGPATPIPPETNSVTDHELSLDGKTIHYSATAGTLLIDGDDAKPYGTVFYVASLASELAV